MNAQQLIQEYEYLNVEQRHDFLANITQIETIKNKQFTAAKQALEELERGEFVIYKDAKTLMNDLV